MLSIFGASFAEESNSNSKPDYSALPVFGGVKPISDQQKLNQLSQTVRKHLHKLDGQANGGNLELLCIHSATSQVVAGTSYKLHAEVNENNSPVNCTIKLWEREWLDFVQLDLECGEENRLYAYVSPTKEEGEESAKSKRQVPGGFQNISPDGLSELFPKLRAVFEQLNSQYADFNANLLRVNGGRYQIVAGTHYIVNVDAVEKANGNAQQCEVDILENLKLQFDQVDVKCAHHDKSFRYSKQ